jgi:hypothetical protein
MAKAERTVEAWQRILGVTLNPRVVAAHLETLERWEKRLDEIKNRNREAK